jgi:hypothetical protein
MVIFSVEVENKEGEDEPPPMAEEDFSSNELYLDDYIKKAEEVEELEDNSLLRKVNYSGKLFSYGANLITLGLDSNEEPTYQIPLLESPEYTPNYWELLREIANGSTETNYVEGATPESSEEDPDYSSYMVKNFIESGPSVRHDAIDRTLEDDAERVNYMPGYFRQQEKKTLETELSFYLQRVRSAA